MTHFFAALDARARAVSSQLCVGLDPRVGHASELEPACVPLAHAVAERAAAIKINVAFFEALGAAGAAALERVVAALPRGPLVILDAKRGDIGATAERYAQEAFERYRADAVTLSPLMGHDSIEPYTRHAGKGLILLCRTSNPGGDDLQNERLASGERLFERIARLAAGPWNENGELGLVVGATYPEELRRVRELAPTLPILVPGIGVQGGDARATVDAGWRGDASRTTGPVIVSSSRAILYAGSDEAAFAAAARRAALAARDELAAARPIGRAP